MARADICGMFWDETPAPKPPKKEKQKAIPPKRFWTLPDYLPGLEDAQTFVPDLFNDMELWQASQNRERLSFDIEVYPNYCLFAFKSIQTGKIIYFELGEKHTLDIPKLKWVLDNFLIVNFNGLKYDFPVISVGLSGHNSQALWIATDMIITQQLRTKEVYKKFKVKKLEVNQIDLIELTALAPGLKVCAGRLHAPRLQDLPFEPGTLLTDDQITILRRYCINDLDNTILLYKAVLPQVELREKMGLRYGIDLRSLSDAQMAEAIIASEVKRITGRKYLQRTAILPGTSYRYQTPSFIKYESELMNHVLGLVQTADFVIDEDGSIIMPPSLSELVIEMNKGKYKFGIGGLHSREKSIAHVANDEYFISDTDVTSYYPNMILNAGMAPKNLGQPFLLVYNGIVVERVSAKQAGNIIVAECLKIVSNGTFGKLGSPWSIVYAPNLMIQVTITGQLSILMLAERFELAGIEVTSINTDGIVVRCLRSREFEFNTIVKRWEKDTGFDTEETRYKATYSRDINNYIAIHETPQKGKQFKLKGAYGPTAPKKNAVNEICIEAVKEFISTGKPLIDTIRECRDLTKFTTMRAVKGGAVKGDPVEGGKPVVSGIYLGKVIRWYLAEGEQGDIIYAKTGNKVALTSGAKPCMDLPAEFPNDIDYYRYEEESTRILYDIGYLVKAEKDNEKECKVESVD
jgi:hypothetical protein